MNHGRDVKVYLGINFNKGLKLLSGRKSPLELIVQENVWIPKNALLGLQCARIEYSIVNQQSINTELNITAGTNLGFVVQTVLAFKGCKYREDRKVTSIFGNYLVLKKVPFYVTIFSQKKKSERVYGGYNPKYNGSYELQTKKVQHALLRN